MELSNERNQQLPAEKGQKLLAIIQQAGDDCSDTKIIALIKLAFISKTEREEFLAYRCICNKYKNYVINYLGNKKFGEAEILKDLFTDAVIVFFQTVRSERFRGDSTIGTFLIATAENIHWNALRKKTIRTTLINVELQAETFTIEDDVLQRDIEELIRLYADEDCIQLLLDRFVNRIKYVDMVKSMKLSMADSPEKALERTKKNFQRCRNKLETTIKEIILKINK